MVKRSKAGRKAGRAGKLSDMCASCGKSIGKGAIGKSGRQFCCTYCCDKYSARSKPKVCEFC